MVENPPARTGERPSPAVASRAALAVTALVIGAGALHFLGVAGWRGGRLWVGIPLTVGGTALMWTVMGRTRGRGVATAAVALAALAATGAMTQAAPLSKGALAERLDGLQLPFFETVSDQRGGHSWCSPECPYVQRRYLAPNIANRDTTLITVALALSKHVEVSEDDLAALSGRSGFRTESEQLSVEVELEEQPDGRHHVVVRLESRR